MAGGFTVDLFFEFAQAAHRTRPRTTRWRTPGHGPGPARHRDHEGVQPGALDKAVDDARRAVDKAVADLPVTQALAKFLAAQCRRNWARLDHDQATGRLGLPLRDSVAQPPADDAKTVEQYVTETANTLAQQQIDAERATKEESQ